MQNNKLNNLQSLRNSVSGSGPANARNVGESLVDIERALARVTLVSLVKLKAMAYAPPIFVAADHKPAEVTVTSCLITGTFVPMIGPVVVWTWSPDGRLQLNAVYGIEPAGLYGSQLVSSQLYDLTLLLIG